MNSVMEKADAKIAALFGTSDRDLRVASLTLLNINTLSDHFKPECCSCENRKIWFIRRVYITSLIPLEKEVIIFVCLRSSRSTGRMD